MSTFIYLSCKRLPLHRRSSVSTQVEVAVALKTAPEDLPASHIYIARIPYCLQSQLQILATLPRNAVECVLGFQITEGWTPECTHMLVANRIQLSVTYALALVLQKVIVTVDW